MADPSDGAAHDLVLFDGVCNLCNASVHFMIDRDRRARLRFASLQSEAGAKALAAHGRGPIVGDPDSIVLVADGRLWEHSDAALRIARRLDGAWPALSVLLVVPRFVRDAVYRFIARNRYRWFGRTEACRIPTPELRARFVS